MLEVIGLSKRFGATAAVDNVSFTVSPYEVLGYLGPNGSGKSTTVKMLTGLLPPTSGEIRLDGRRIQDGPVGYKRRLGYVPEEPHIYSYLTGPEYLRLLGGLRGMPAAKLENRIEGFLSLLSLWPHRFTPISSYSKGMKQKVLITAALLHDPDVLIFDEPLSGLDVTTALVFRSLLEKLAARGKIILYSSHVLEVVEKACHRVMILRRGRVAAHDSVEHLRDLMKAPSLEDIFSQLVLHEDPEQMAREMVAVMQC